MFEKYNSKGLTGLANLGNTCFLNTILQCLSHTYEFKQFLDNDQHKDKLNKIPESLLLVEWNSLQQMMWKENCVIQPNKFLKIVHQVAKFKKRDIFTGYSQNDCQEFFVFLLECFHSSMQREVEMEITGDVKSKKDELAIKCYEMMKDMYTKEYSEILNFFSGILITKIMDIDEKEILSIKTEPIFMISLAVNNGNSLEQLFDNFVLSEKLVDDDQYFNDKLNEKQDAVKKTLFWSLPEILVIDLKRWSITNKRKISSIIDFPLENLDLSKFISGYKKDSYVYDLYGICNHTGGTNGGHYFAYVKNANKKWYIFNDTIVKEMSESKLVSQYAYCLFYRKKK